MSRLAIKGGPRAIERPFEPYNSIGIEEAEAARKVVESGELSGFLAGSRAEFFGGPAVQNFERSCERSFQVRHAVSMNSGTSGLIAALGAVGIEPGDEVIVSPWTMSASATAILVWNAIPVFVDIEQQTFNLDPSAVAAAITSRTRAIVAVDIFGHAAALGEIMVIAAKHGLSVIEDCAQAPHARYNDAFAGTVGHVGVYSLNRRKHIQTGEGGFCVTNDPDLAERMQLIRNHGEAVVAGKGVTNLADMLGFNFRFGEIEAAIGIEQLKKLPAMVEGRRAAAERLTRGLSELPGLATPVVMPGCTHVYFVYPLRYDEEVTGVSRNVILEALAAEGVPGMMAGYANLHLLPMYQKKIAYGRQGYPWSSSVHSGAVSYEKGICPVAEALQDSSFIGIKWCEHRYSTEETDLVMAAFHKLWDSLSELRRQRVD